MLEPKSTLPCSERFSYPSYSADAINLPASNGSVCAAYE